LGILKYFLFIEWKMRICRLIFSLTKTWLFSLC
jgi:hypothetical protein